jgi:hypothetical protein
MIYIKKLKDIFSKLNFTAVTMLSTIKIIKFILYIIKIPVFSILIYDLLRKVFIAFSILTTSSFAYLTFNSDIYDFAFIKNYYNILKD